MVYRINGEKVTKEEWDARPKKGITPGKPCTVFASSFEGFVSPVDGSYIDSKPKLQEHNARNDVVQVGNDYVNQDTKSKSYTKDVEFKL